MRPGTKRWTIEEDKILQYEALIGSSVTEIASKLGRSEAAVRVRAHALKLLLRVVGIRRRSSTWRSGGAANKGLSS